jgi:hypothetical protein
MNVKPLLIILLVLLSVASVNAIPWWNSSMTSRYNVTSMTSNINLPMVINGSNGYKVNGVKRFIWYNPSMIGGNVSVYNGTGSIYALANDTTRAHYDEPNGIKNIPNSIYNTTLDSNTTVFALHFEQNSSILGWNDSTGINGVGNLQAGSSPIFVNGTIMGNAWDFSTTTRVNWNVINTNFDKYQNENITYLFWVYFNSTNEEHVFGKGNSLNAIFFYTGRGTNTSRIYIQARGRGASDLCDISLDNQNFANRTVQFAWVMNATGGTSTLYMNGTVIGSQSGAGCLEGWNNSLNFTLGSGQEGLVSPFKGIIDEFYIFKRALGWDEINASYNNTVNRNNLLSPQQEIPFFGNNASTIVPASGSGSENLKGYCYAETIDSTDFFINYTWYLNGLINSSGTGLGPYPTGVIVSVSNISSTQLGIAQKWILQCNTYNNTHSLIFNSSTAKISSLHINVTIYDQNNNSLLLENVSMDSSSVLESIQNSTITGRTTIYLNELGTYTVTFTSPNYAPVSYKVVANGSTSELVLNVRLLRSAVAYNFTINLQDSLNRVIPGARIIIERAYGGIWSTVIDTITDDGGATHAPLEPGVSYVMSIDASGFPFKQFVQVFLTANNPYLYRLTISGGGVYSDVFNDVNYTYSPTNLSVGNYSNDFTFNVYSKDGLLEWASVSDAYNSSNMTGTYVIISSMGNDLSTHGGETVPVTYCFKQSGYEQYCFKVNYFVEGREPSSNNFINSLKAFKDMFVGGSSNAWLTIIAIFGVLMICIITSELSGNPVVTTISGFAGLITFTFLGWLSPILTGVVCVIGLALFFMNKQGGY